MSDTEQKSIDEFFFELKVNTQDTIVRKSILNKSKIEYVDWNCNPIVGCGHSCTYCYARMIDLRFKKVSSAVEWHRPKIVENYMDLIEKKIHLVEDHEEIFLSTMSDVYGGDINDIGIARNIIKRFQDAGLRYRLLTKSSKIIRDMDIFEGYSKGLHGLSITTNESNEKMVKKWEPRTDPITDRLEALHELTCNENINVWVSSEPFLPNTNFDLYLEGIMYNGQIGYGTTLKEIVVGKMNYQAGIDDLFDWPNVVNTIEKYRKDYPKINWHYKKEFVNFLDKNYPGLEPKGGYP